jgi:long-chain acyl-CoA synthetase
MKGWFRLQVKGRENLPAQGQCLITPNHLSVLDPLVMAAANPDAILRRTYFAGWTGIAFKNVFFRFISRLARAVPIDDRHAISSSLAFGSAVLGRGSNLIWFPEGGRSPDGTLMEFKPGVGLLLEHHDLPVLPVFIHGTYDALPKGRKFPRPVKVTIIIGKPLTLEELQQNQQEESFRDRVRNGLLKRVEGLRAET